MLLPALKPYRKASKKFILDFLGFNANPVPREGEFSDMKNLSSDFFPCISPRKSRQELISIANNNSDSRNAVLAKNGKLAWTDGATFYYGTPDDYESKGTVDNTAGIERTLVSMGDRVLIFPDKIAYNVVDFADDPNGYLLTKPLNYEDEIAQSSEIPIYINIGDLNYDKMTFNHLFNGQNNSLIDLNEGDYIKITYERPYPLYEQIKYAFIKKIFIEREEGETPTDEIWFEKDTFGEDFTLTSIKIERLCPDIAYAITNDNRCWGIKGNNIYASAQGNPFNWNQFQGLLTDSYAVDVDTNGDFTGAAVYSGNPIFFKEDYIHRVYGNSPKSYQIVTAQAYGVQKGAYNTVININNTLFYMSRVGVMAYNGGYPTLISDNFGANKYQGLGAGTDGRKYYLSLKDLSDNTYKLFVYDTLKNLWHIEDATNAPDFAFSEGSLYMLNATKGKIELLDAGTELVNWEATLGEFNEVIDDKKGYSKLSIRTDLDRSSELNVLIKYDNSEWITVKSVSGGDKRVIDIPIIPLRCDTFQIKLTGKGFCKIYSLNREFVFGGR